MLNLDTHILIKVFEGSLTPRERSVLTADPEWSISAIVLWEIAKLHQLGRVGCGLDNEALAAAVDRVQVGVMRTDKSSASCFQSVVHQADAAADRV